jgi:type VII secretion-associated protein (TIGR03931 family)
MVRTAITATAVCEIGPVSVRRWGCDAAEPASQATVAAALDAGDDPLILLGERAVAVDDVWHALLAPLLHGTDKAVLVHPSWWTPLRIAVVDTVARTLSGDVVTKPRSWLLAVVAREAPVVEIGPQVVVVTVGEGVPVAIQTRALAPGLVADSVVREILRDAEAGPVWLDGPAGVPGAEVLGVLIGDRLRAAGRAVWRVDDRHLARAAVGLVKHEEVPDDSPRRGRRRLLVATGCAVLTVVLAAAAWGGTRADRPVTSRTTALVEGRVTMQIPADWVVQRITAGPGSARIQVVSPTDGETALHMTQSSVRDDSLDAAAAILRRAIDAQPSGVFVDFHPSDVRGDRPAVTYREIRQGHDIRWTVLLDGAVRISIGCQSAAGAEHNIAVVCEQAVRSAHEIR